MSILEKAINDFENDKLRIRERIIETIQEELRVESNRNDFQFLEDNLKTMNNVESYINFYSFKMIRRKAENLFINYSKFEEFFLSSINQNNEDNFSKNLMSFLASLRKFSPSDIFESENDIIIKISNLLNEYITEEYQNKHYLVDSDIYNLILIMYTDIFIYYHKNDLLQNKDIENNSNIKSTLNLTSEDSLFRMFNDFDQAATAAMKINEKLNKSSGFLMNISVNGNSSRNIEKEFREVSKEIDFKKELLNTIYNNV